MIWDLMGLWSLNSGAITILLNVLSFLKMVFWKKISSRNGFEHAFVVM